MHSHSPVHEVSLVGLCGRLDRVRDVAEALKHLLDVAAVLHRDDAAVVLLIAPREGSLLIIVEDATAVWPGTRSSSSAKELGGAGLLEKESACLQCVLVGLGERA